MLACTPLKLKYSKSKRRIIFCTMSLVYNLSYSEIGGSRVVDKRLALVTGQGPQKTFTFLPVTLSNGKVKYPICMECGTPVVWSKGTCRCGNLEEKPSTEYKVVSMDQNFSHTTWCQ
ncbi:hypothetical protein [Brazilian marseillevirus]|uniref:hypothetical protein n=1 Tax=Brazilian marseillevirus TaxID=1813599 RepID=UPI00078510DA|nr:hypothetical protein A3303_gp029 [Brazilian marseillevirus]AMQ10537.1 hypothetical protein [Brazilian marseillevirus]